MSEEERIALLRADAAQDVARATQATVDLLTTLTTACVDLVSRVEALEEWCRGCTDAREGLLGEVPREERRTRPSSSCRVPWSPSDHPDD